MTEKLQKELEQWKETGPHTSYPWCTIPDAIMITAEHFYNLALEEVREGVKELHGDKPIYNPSLGYGVLELLDRLKLPEQ